MMPMDSFTVENGPPTVQIVSYNGGVISLMVSDPNSPLDIESIKVDGAPCAFNPPRFSPMFVNCLSEGFTTIIVVDKQGSWSGASYGGAL